MQMTFIRSIPTDDHIYSFKDVAIYLIICEANYTVKTIISTTLTFTRNLCSLSDVRLWLEKIKPGRKYAL